MKDKRNLYPIGLAVMAVILVIALLFGLWGLFFKERKPVDNPEPVEINEPIEKAQLEFKDYKVYKFDNVDYKILLTQYESDQAINLKEIKTTENFTLDQSQSLLSSLKALGYDLHEVSVDISEKSTGLLLIPVYDLTLESIELSSDTIELTNTTFSLTNPLEDKTLLGYVEEEIEETDPIEEQPPIEEVKLFNEVDPNLVLYNNEPVGYPSNIRVFVLDVTLSEGASAITSATLHFTAHGVSVNAVSGELEVNGKQNILNQPGQTSGVLIFELNGAQDSITDISYSVDMVGGQ